MKLGFNLWRILLLHGEELLDKDVFRQDARIAIGICCLYKFKVACQIRVHELLQ